MNLMQPWSVLKIGFGLLFNTYILHSHTCIKEKSQNKILKPNNVILGTSIQFLLDTDIFQRRKYMASNKLLWTENELFITLHYFISNIGNGNKVDKSDISMRVWTVNGTKIMCVRPESDSSKDDAGTGVDKGRDAASWSSTCSRAARFVLRASFSLSMPSTCSWLTALWHATCSSAQTQNHPTRPGDRDRERKQDKKDKNNTKWRSERINNNEWIEEMNQKVKKKKKRW